MSLDDRARTSPFLSYDIRTGTHRSAAEEWQPHRTQTDKSVEWWYLTSVLHDVAGTPYFLFWCIFHYIGQKYMERLPPAAAEKIKSGQSAYVCLFTLTNYRTNARTESPLIFVMPDEDVWDAATSTLRLQDAQRRHGCTWSFDGERMTLRARSRGLACSLAMRGGSQVMWAKDKLGKEGLIQEGPEGDYSFYYSLPRLEISGSIGHIEDGRPTTSEVAGFGWVDRQWGDFLTSAWEWASFRFTSGARVNLYNFYNGHRVATYQRADGSTHWFDDFVVKQNGYARTSLGTWVS